MEGRADEGEEGEEMDVDESIDKMKMVQDTTPNAVVERSAGVFVVLHRVDKPETPRREYDSALVSALAVLGAKEDAWKDAEQYPPVLSAIIKVAQSKRTKTLRRSRMALHCVYADLSQPISFQGIH